MLQLITVILPLTDYFNFISNIVVKGTVWALHYEILSNEVLQI